MSRFRLLLSKLYSYQIVKYTCVGAVNTLVIFSLFFLWVRLFGCSPIRANRIGYAGGLICNFTLNKLWTFRSRRFRAMEIVLFLVSFAVSYGIQLLCFLILMDGWGWSEGKAAILAYPLYGVAFFLQCRHVAFKQEKSRPVTRTAE